MTRTAASSATIEILTIPSQGREQIVPDIGQLNDVTGPEIGAPSKISEIEELLTCGECRAAATSLLEINEGIGREQFRVLAFDIIDNFLSKKDWTDEELRACLGIMDVLSTVVDKDPMGLIEQLASRLAEDAAHESISFVRKLEHILGEKDLRMAALRLIDEALDSNRLDDSALFLQEFKDDIGSAEVVSASERLAKGFISISDYQAAAEVMTLAIPFDSSSVLCGKIVRVSQDLSDTNINDVLIMLDKAKDAYKDRFPEMAAEVADYLRLDSRTLSEAVTVVERYIMHFESEDLPALARKVSESIERHWNRAEAEDFLARTKVN